MARTTYQDLLDAGVHFGHLTRKWDPKMAKYIFMERNGIQKLEIAQDIPLDVLQLLNDMQVTHDQTSVDFWEDDFAFTARKFKLKYTEPTNELC